MDRMIGAWRRLWWILPLLALVLTTSLPGDLPARPGGGHSYSGGSHSYGGGSSSSHSYSGGSSSHSYGSGSYSGGGGSTDGVGFIILLIEYPQVSIPIIVLIILWRVYVGRNNAPQEAITTRSSRETMIWNRRKVDNWLYEFRENADPEFSQTLFLDFAQRIYNQYHHHRTHPEINDLRPYFDREIIVDARPRQDFKIDVSELVIGSVDFVNLQYNDNKAHISVRFDANYTETIAGHSNRWWVQETWFFARSVDVTSPAPEVLAAIGCPNCGAALSLTPTGACQFCNEAVQPGSKTWMVEAITIGHREVRRGEALGAYSPEQGTNLPTLFDPRLVNMGKIFADRHQLENITVYAATFKDKIVEPVFKAVYAAWTARTYAPVRPLMSDNLFASHYYWVEAYRKQQRINRLDDLAVTGVHLVKLDLDKYYEAATVRIFASCKDYTTDEAGKFKAGNAHFVRRFSEYWTFVRRTGVEKDETTYDPAQCPNCGAPVDMGMTGVCSYCQSKVTTGEFGWILSRITQDEAYYG